jgi:hypothetical protein
MTDLSNRSLALLLVAAVIISLGTTMLSLNYISRAERFAATGFAAGQLNLTIGNLTACNIDTNVDFGTGNPVSTIPITTDTANPASFNDCTSVAACRYGIQINNTGNTKLNVSFASAENASVFLGDGTSNLSAMKYKAYNGTLNVGTSKGCTIGTLGATTYTPINQTPWNYTICTNLTPDQGQDIVSIGFNLTVNETTPKNGTKSNQLTIYCTMNP